MCIIKRYNLVHPNGAPERKDQLQYCQFGSPVNPCNNTRIVHLRDAYVQWPGPALGSPYQAERIEPTEAPRAFRREKKQRLKKIPDGLKLVWDFHIPFTSRKSEKKRPTPRNAFVRRRGSQQRHETPNPMPPEFPVWPPWYGPQPQGGPEIVQVPHGPQQRAPRAAEPQVIRPRRNHPLNVRIHQAGDSSSPSPPTHLRQHHRHHNRTPSETRRYEELKRQVRDRERRDHVERQQRDQAERDARDAREADEARNRREIERLERENIELLRGERRRQQQEEERRHNQERERRHRQEQERQMEEEERRQRHHEFEQQERRRRRQDAIEREQARRQQERDDLQALQEEAARQQIRRDQIRRDQIRRDQIRRDEILREQDERDRIARQRRAGIPRGPRHRPEVHHRRGRSFDERGEQVIDDAIRDQDRRRFEDRAPVPPRRGWSRRRDVGGGLRRRDTIAVTQRGVYEDDRRRGGRRFI